MEVGATQIEYENEDQKNYEIFETRRHNAGATCRLRSMATWCTQKEME
jgi:hypothetical protein